MYHYRVAGREQGPIGAERLVDLFVRGVVGPDDGVRIDGTTSWRRAADVIATLRGGPRRGASSPEAPAPEQHPRPGRTLLAGASAGVVVSPEVDIVLVSTPPASPPPTQLAVPGAGDTWPVLREEGRAGGALRAPVPATGILETEPPGAAVVSDIPPTLDVVGARVPHVAAVPPTLDVAAVPPALHVAGPVGTSLRRPAQAEARSRARRASAPLLSRRAALLGAAGLLLAILAFGLFTRFTANLRGGPWLQGSVVRTGLTIRMDSGQATLKRGAHSATGLATFREERTRETRCESEVVRLVAFPVERLESTLRLDGETPVSQVTLGPLHGRTVRVDSAGVVPKVELLGAPSTDREARRLEALSDPEAPVYPAARLWPGRTFAVSTPFACRLVAIDDACEGTASMELVRFVRYRGARAAELVLRARVEGRRGEAMLSVTLEGTVYRSLDDFVDLSVDARGALRSLGRVPAGRAGTALLDLQGTVQVTEESTLTRAP